MDITNLQIIYRCSKTNGEAPFALVAADNPEKNEMLRKLNERASDLGYVDVSFVLHNTVALAKTPCTLKHIMTERLGKAPDKTSDKIPDKHPKKHPNKNFVTLIISDMYHRTNTVRIHKSNMPLIYTLLTGKAYIDNGGDIDVDFKHRLTTFINYCLIFEGKDNKDIEDQFIAMLSCESCNGLQSFMFDRINYIKLIINDKYRCPVIRRDNDNLIVIANSTAEAFELLSEYQRTIASE